jgi:signal transduction histidine kinase
VGGAVVGYRLRVRSIEARSRRLEGLVEERTSQLEAFYLAEEKMHRHLHLDQVLQALVDVAVEVLQADKSAVYVWDKEREKWVMRVACGFSPEAMTRLSFAQGEGSIGHAVASGERVVVEDAVTDPLRQRERPEAVQIALADGVRSFMHLPIQIDGQTFGVFNVSFTEPHAFGQDEQRLFLALVQRASLAIENARLYGQAQDLAALEERQRLARDLHDAVTQTLFSTSLIAEVLPRIWEQDPDDGRRRLEQVRHGARSALAEMRTLLLELRPTGLADADLGDLLRQLGEAITGRSRVLVEVDVEGEPDLPPDVHVALYRIAQEALNNAAKHARASQATVCLHCIPPASGGDRGGAVTLFIQDNGRGFDPDDVSPDHLGLGIMRERAEAIGARFKIESQIGHGTQVTVVWTADEGRVTHGE